METCVAAYLGDHIERIIKSDLRDWTMVHQHHHTIQAVCKGLDSGKIKNSQTSKERNYFPQEKCKMVFTINSLLF